MACITKRRGRWVIDFYDQHGKRRWKTLKAGTTKKAARDELRSIEDLVSKGVYLPDGKISIFSKVSKDWLEYKKPKIRKSTLLCYQQDLETHFENLNPVKINRVSIASVEEFISEKQNEGMNIQTLRKILVTFNQVMNYAVWHRYIDYNPVQAAERPRAPQGEHSQKKITVLSPSQINDLFEATEDIKYRALFRLAAFSGARQGEILGLKWSDVIWENNQIHIQRTFNHAKFFAPKSRESNRKIDIGPAMMLELKKWKLGCPKCDLDLVLPSEAGTPIDHQHMIPRHFNPALKKAGIPDTRFHDLRHTYASLLVEQGENITYIQNQLGHSNPTTTLSIYAHLMKPVNQEAACKLENTFLNESGSKMVADSKEDSK